MMSEDERDVYQKQFGEKMEVRSVDPLPGNSIFIELWDYVHNMTIADSKGRPADLDYSAINSFLKNLGFERGAMIEALEKFRIIFAGMSKAKGA